MVRKVNRAGTAREYLVPKSKRVKPDDGFIERKDLMQDMKALNPLIGLKVRAIRRRRPCTERRPPRRDGSRAVTVRLAVRVDSKQAVGTRQTWAVELPLSCSSSAVTKALSAARYMGAGAGRSQSDLTSTLHLWKCCAATAIVTHF